MVGLRGRPPAWDRFAFWAPGAAMLVLAFAALLLALAAFTDRSEREVRAIPLPSTQLVEEIDSRPAGSASPRDTDLQLYDSIATRVAAGEDYYAVAVEEQRARDFPVRPGLAVRLPTLAFINAAIGEKGLLVAAILLGLATLAAWWRRLGDEPGAGEHRVIALLLLVIGSVMGLKPQYLVLHEVWAGMLLALAFALHRRGRWWPAWIAAALALAIRELALPFVLLMGALAFWRRDVHEGVAWTALAVLFLIGLAVHLGNVDAVISAADRSSPSWLAFRGLGGWTSNIVLSSSLYLLSDIGAGWLAAMLALLPLLGWAGWRGDAGLFGVLLFAGYGLVFMIAGRDNNFYWALVVTPAWFVGLVFVPRAVRSLWQSARGH